MYCRNCGEEIADDSRFCPYCGFGTGSSTDFQCRPGPSVVYSERSEALTLLMSFLITGLGHIYVGKTAAGIKLIVLQVLLAVLFTLALMVSPYLVVIGIVPVILWMYAMYESCMICREYNTALRDYGYPPW